MDEKILAKLDEQIEIITRSLEIRDEDWQYTRSLSSFIGEMLRKVMEEIKKDLDCDELYALSVMSAATTFQAMIMVTAREEAIKKKTQ